MKSSSSQWEFGELFPAQQARRVLSVSELTGQVRRLLEEQIGAIWVTGEVTNLRSQSSGHIYFTLKDANAQVNCVLFRGEKVAHRELLKDGQKLLLQGDITVYEARGQYQLIVHQVELQGVGALQLAFEKLKQKLQAEGLFAPEHKRALPKFAERIGLVTSPTGAAIRDVLHVVRRRHPGLEIILAPCRVQGDGAAQEIAAAIGLLNAWSSSDSDQRLDLILVTRGGGSLEDLWAFNEEVVARAIYDSAVPIVSAVGHEIDFTISDFVADARAATPSAGAEIITEGMYASREFAAEAAVLLRQRMLRRLGDLADELEGTRERLLRLHPRRQWNERVQRLDDLREAFGRSVRQGLRFCRQNWVHQAERFLRVRPAATVRRRAEQLEQWAQRLREWPRRQWEERRQSLELMHSRLRLLGPEAVLARGYSITMLADTGEVLRDAKDVRPGQHLRTRLKDGQVLSQVTELKVRN